MANYAEQLQAELTLSDCRIVTVSVDNYLNTLEHRHAVGAFWPFLCDFEREVVAELDIQDHTDKRYSPVAIPYTFVLNGQRRIHKIYNGWWYYGRPRVEELRTDMQGLLAQTEAWPYRPIAGAALTAEPPAALAPGQTMPDFSLADQTGRQVQLSSLVAGWPTAVTFLTGDGDPADLLQLTAYVRELQADMRSGYFNLVSVQPGEVAAAADLRLGLGAQWTFLADPAAELMRQLGLQHRTDGPTEPLPFTFLIDDKLQIHKAYYGRHFAGRPSVEALRLDFRALMEQRPDYAYDDTWDFRAIHSEKRFELTHGLMEHFHPDQVRQFRESHGDG